MAIKSLSSPLISSFNIISNIGASKKMASKLQNDFSGFLKFIEVQNSQLNSIKLPEKRKIKAIASFNVVSTFGSPGNLLSSLASGALDVAGFLGNFFPSRGKTGKPLPIGRMGSGGRIGGIRPPKVTPKGSKLRFGGVKGLGLLNALFAGLDFYQGLQEGETVGKAASGAGASLAGSIIGGALGATLGSVLPGFGTVAGGLIGSTIGGFAGGWLGDRTYELATGGKGGVSQKLQERSKKQLELQRQSTSDKSSNIISDFGEAVDKFDDFVNRTFATMVNAAAKASGSKELMLDYGLDPNNLPNSPNNSPGQLLENMQVTGGELPSRVVSSAYGWRWGRMHSGVDYPRPKGTLVSAIQPGTVTYARFNDGGYGNLVEIAHPGGTSTYYGHLDQINVKEGQQIEPGTVIGKVGTTGRSTGPHVHFEVRKDGRATSIPNNEGDKYFRFGGDVKVNASTSGGTNLGTGSSEQKVMNYLMQQGLSKEQAAGIAGNLKQESGFDPKSGLDRGSHRGIAQWDKKVRWPRISKYIGSIGMDPNSLEGQLAGMKWEAERRGSWRQITSATSAENAAKIWLDSFEVSGEKPGQTGYENRMRYARDIAKKSYGIESLGRGGPDLPQYMVPAENKNKSNNQIRQYPSYNQQQSSMTIVPIAVNTSSNKPVVIPTPSGSPQSSNQSSMNRLTESDVVNSFVKIALLTNLSST